MNSQPGPVRRTSKEQFDSQAGHYDAQWARWTDESLGAMFSLYAPQPEDVVLDVATGTGYTALGFAPLVNKIVAADISSGMLAQARRNAYLRSINNIRFCETTAETMPFMDRSFSLVTCRIAAHHFVSIPEFLSESYRVLRDGGRLLLADTAVPDEDEASDWQNRLELVRDPSHIGNLSEQQWRKHLLSEGFEIHSLSILQAAVPIEVRDWMVKAGCNEEQKQNVLGMLATAPKSAVDHFRIHAVEADWRLSWYRVVACARKTRRDDGGP